MNKKEKTTPLARAVRLACATSTAALVLVSPNIALGQSCVEAVDGTIYCDGAFNDGITFQGADLFLVLGRNAPTSVSNIDGDGVYTRSAADIRIESDATIQASGDGIEIESRNLDASGSIDNTGDINAATGIRVVAGQDAAVQNSGRIDATANGMLVNGRTGDAVATNTGVITVDSTGNASGATVWALGDVRVTNAGSISVSGTAGGTQDDIVSITGIDVGSRGVGTAHVLNTGSVAVTSSGMPGVGALFLDNAAITVGAREAVVVNSGSVSMVSRALATGIQVSSEFGGSVHADNSGRVSVDSQQSARGISLFAPSGELSILNSGEVRAVGGTHATGIDAWGGDTTIELVGGSTVVATGHNGDAQGVRVQTQGGATSIAAAGDIVVDGYGETSGILLYAVGGGPVRIDHAGAIRTTSSQGEATGISVNGHGSEELSVNNAGRIEASGQLQAAGIEIADAGTATVSNSGVIRAQGAERAVGIQVDARTSTIHNSGSIDTVSANDGRIAIQGGGGTVTINNSGDIHGALVTNAGADTLNNSSGGTWFVDNHSTDFGQGDDLIYNAAGGVIHFIDGAIHMGGGSNNAFNNAGTLRITGQGLVNLGGSDAVAGDPGRPAAPPGNALPLNNDGLIDMADGAAHDRLTVVGDMGGNGSINIDVMVPSGPADTLVVQGSMVAGAQQTVNAWFHPSLLEAAQSGASVAFARVSGDSAADSFVGGQVLGFAPGNFIDLGVRISSDLDTSNATDDVFHAGVEVTGLNPLGGSAASIGSGAWSLMTSAFGTWRQRMGVVPASSSERPLAAFVRAFRDEGDVSQAHTAVNPNAGGSLDFSQRNSGTEVGLNFEPAQGINVGVLAGSVRATQHLRGDIESSDRLDGDMYALYGTWVGQRGGYLDVSYRALRFDAMLDSVEGRREAEGKAGAFNVEAGMAFAPGGRGLRLEPQIQYTWTRVDDMTVQGAQLDFRTEESEFRRARIGLALWKPIEARTITWTPYAAASVVRVAGGRVRYSVGDLFSGDTDVEGTSALVELGLGVDMGAVSGTVGAHWSDGGALDSVAGGQLVLRYDW